MEGEVIIGEVINVVVSDVEVVEEGQKVPGGGQAGGKGTDGRVPLDKPEIRP